NAALSILRFPRSESWPAFWPKVRCPSIAFRRQRCQADSMVGTSLAPDRRTTAWLRRRGVLSPRSMSRHRNVQGGAARAAVLGAGDGLITHVSLVLGVA